MTWLRIRVCEGKLRKHGLLDPVDFRILDLLRQTPTTTQSKLAHELGMSQPWIATRVKYLREKGILTSASGINFERLGLVVGMIGLSAKRPYYLIRKYRCCPYFLGALILSGERNLTLEFCGEDSSSLQGIADQHIRQEPEASNVEFRLINHITGDLTSCPRLVLDRREKSPCGIECMNCIQYESGGCVGCPATVYYRGTFWNGGNGNNRHHAVEAAVPA
jgi:Lrp/AsnC family leucine-responsive transcriptional regulator